MEITAAMVKELREKTGAGVMESKRALQQANGDLKAAEKILAELAGGRVEKKAGREAKAGLVECYIHTGGRVGAMVELNCETDFVARNEAFQKTARDIAMQVAAMDPKYLSAKDMPDDETARPEDVALLSQKFIKDGSKTVEDLVRDLIAKTGENVVLRRFARFELGV